MPGREKGGDVVVGLVVLVIVVGVVLLGLPQYRARTARRSGGETGVARADSADSDAPEQVRRHPPDPRRRPPDPRRRPPDPRRRPPALAESLGYVGAVLAMAGVTQLVARSWSDFEQPVRISLLGGLAAVLLAAGLLLRNEGEPPIWRLRGFLLLLSTVSLAGCVGIVLVDSFGMEGASVTIGVGLVVAGYSALLWMLRDRPAQQATTFVGVLLAVGGTMALADGAGAVGLSMSAVGAAWLWAGFALDQVSRSASTELGLVAVLLGPAVTFESFREVSPALGIAVAAAVIVVGTRSDHFVVTGAGVLALMAYVPFAVAQWFGDALEASGVLVVSGLMLIGVTLVLIKRRSPGRPATPAHR